MAAIGIPGIAPELEAELTLGMQKVGLRNRKLASLNRGRCR